MNNMIMNNHLQFFIYLFTFSIFLGSCHPEKKENKDPKQQAPVSFIEGFIVKPSVINEAISISGTLIPFEETSLMPEVAGRVVMINLPEGQFVKKGTLLVKIFDGDLQANLKKSQTQLEIAEQTLKRQSELIKIDGISQLEYDQTRLQVTSIKDDIELLKVQIGKTEVVAPYDGVIGLKNISPGAQVTPSTTLVTIRMKDKLKLDFAVPEKYSQSIKPGLKVMFSVHGDDKKYEAEVIASEEGIETVTRNLRVRAVVNKVSPSLVPGAFANVELRLNENKNALMIPTQAIIPMERNKQVIISDGSKAKFITVKTGIRTASQIEILEGINEGDTVVTTGILFIKPGSELKFSKVRSGQS
jgi:membrane fusion protein (multidrug efflux system)